MEEKSKLNLEKEPEQNKEKNREENLFQNQEGRSWKKILGIVLSLGLVVIIILSVIVSSPSIGAIDVSLDRDLVAMTVTEGSSGSAGVMFVEHPQCMEIKEGCEEIVNKIENWGLDTENYDSWTKKERECLVTGCKDWGNSDREFVTLTLTSQEVTTIVNEFVSAEVPLASIKVKFEDGKILASGSSSFPVVPGNINGEGQIDLYDKIKINKLYLGRVPVPQKYVDYFEETGNEYLRNVFAQYSIIVSMMRVEDDKLIFSAYVPKGSVKRVDGKLVLNLNKKPGSSSGDGDFRIQ